MAGKVDAALVWASWVVLAAYSIYVLVGYWSQLSDLETTLRLVGSDVGCSLSAISCSWSGFWIDKIAGIAIIGIAFRGLFLREHYRNRILAGAAILAAAHLVTLYWLFNPA